MESLERKQIYSNAKYYIRVGPVEVDKIELSQCYVIADGGYIKLPSIFCAFYNQAELERIKYKVSDWIGSAKMWSVSLEF
jgi:hypothetical protein